MKQEKNDDPMYSVCGLKYTMKIMFMQYPFILLLGVTKIYFRGNNQH